jgi:hypothetical protein
VDTTAAQRKPLPLLPMPRRDAACAAAGTSRSKPRGKKGSGIGLCSTGARGACLLKVLLEQLRCRCCRRLRRRPACPKDTLLPLRKGPPTHLPNPDSALVVSASQGGLAAAAPRGQRRWARPGRVRPDRLCLLWLTALQRPVRQGVARVYWRNHFAIGDIPGKILNPGKTGLATAALSTNLICPRRRGSPFQGARPPQTVRQKHGPPSPDSGGRRAPRSCEQGGARRRTSCTCRDWGGALARRRQPFLPEDVGSRRAANGYLTM